MKAFAKNKIHNGSSNSALQKKGEDSFFGIQAKLAIGKPEDNYEKEADIVADKVVQNSETPSLFLGNGNFFPHATHAVMKSSENDLQKKEDMEEIQEKQLVETITPVVPLASEDDEIQQKGSVCETKEAIAQRKPYENLIQKQQAPPRPPRGCQQLSNEQREEITSVARAGIIRMHGYIQNPKPIIGANQQQRIINSIRGHIRSIIQLTQDFISDFSARNLVICVLDGVCPNHANACFIPVDRHIFLSPRVLTTINLNTIAAIIHEYKHFQQHAAFDQAVTQSPDALIHTELDELNIEYEANLVDAIFTGTQIRARQARVVERDGMVASQEESGHELNGHLNEVLTFATTHPVSTGPTNRSDLPVLNSGYRDQIARNSNVIHYRIQWNRRTGIATLINQSRRVRLGRFSESSILDNRSIELAFWASSEANVHLARNYRRAVLIVHTGNEIITQTNLGRPSSAYRPMPERNEQEVERPFFVPNQRNR